MAEVRGDHIKIEVDALANGLENKMRSTNLNISPRCCIFKVPNILRRHNPEAYAPNGFSIGPYHYGKKHLKATQKIKLKYLHDLISGFEDPKAKLRTLIEAISEVQQEARDCYADPIDHISQDEFINILVLDGCFLIELFRKNADDKLQKNDDPVFKMSCMRQFLCHDLILLENQIPWMVLEILFAITRKPEDQTTSNLSLLVLWYCYTASITISKFPSDINAVFEPFLSREHGSKHILDLLRNSMVLSSSITEVKDGEWKSMPSATRLREAGIKFKEGTSTSIFDIKFDHGVIEIPPLSVQETTESVFRNLICLEQCLPNCAHMVTSYAILLDNLINTTDDMEILCKRGSLKIG
ncbi:hypothetical protein TIFTF001_010697 [Ficus carica]|uniref:Uncharacterized protein n=1 Tax=Ficus carica TaxID=3494 RepID=A0AA87ZYM7_FICCA|nr:hypothetical protein TIFTF001_010697 [Ficus carica]